VYGSTRFRESEITPIGSLPRSSGTPSEVRRPDATAPGTAKSGSAGEVLDMHDPAFERHPADDAVATGDNGSPAQGLPKPGVRCSRLVGRHIAVDLALVYCNRCGVGAAKPGGGFDHCVQHRLHIGGRAADDVQHVAGRGLVFERFFEVAGTGLQFAEQPRVLHRDDRLHREVFQERDLFFREWPHLVAAARDHAEQRPVFAQRQ